MTAHEALWLVKAQLYKTEQNIQAIKVLDDIVKSVSRLRIDDEPKSTLGHLFGDEKTYTLDEAIVEVYGTEAEHFKNHISKIGKKDLKQFTGKWITRDGKKSFIANDSLDYYFDTEEE